MSIHIQIERFEGPLGLLLHLIRREEMDIFDINIHLITKQYLDYIKAMKKLDLEVAGEFVAMAATLIHIKSRMLLPDYNEEGEEEINDDPRKGLVQKLLEYQKYQEASQSLYERPLLGRDVWVRGSRLDLSKDTEEEIVVEENALFALIRAYRSVVRTAKQGVHKVAGELQSIASRILEIKDRLLVGQRRLFHELISTKVSDGEKHSNQVLVTFLAMLELAKMGFVSLFQSDNFSDIHIETKKTIDRDVIARAEDFDAHQSSQELDIDLAADANPDALSTEDEVKAVISDEFDEDAVEGAPPWPDEVVEQEQLDPLVEAATDDEIAEEERRMAEEDRQSREPELALVKEVAENSEDPESPHNPDRPLEDGL